MDFRSRTEAFTYDNDVVLTDSIFERSVAFEPGQDFEAFLKSVPAKGVVYLLADGEGRPVQLLCVRNLRGSLKRRLGGEEGVVGLSKRVNLREIVRRVYWRHVDSAFEADWVYLEAARALFPKTYQGMVGFRPAWFVQVDAGAAFPRWVKTTKIEGAGGTRAGESSIGRGRPHPDPLPEGEGESGRKGSVWIGPIEEKQAAQRLIELLEDWFDLCRYYNVLVEAPRGKACAYKEMGRCAAPCDGTVGMDVYRRAIEESVRAVVTPGEFLRELEGKMKQAAGELKFEAAGQIKKRMEQVGQLGKGAYRHMGRLEEFVWVTLQRGPREGTGKLFLVTANEIEEVVGVIGEMKRWGEVLRYVLERAEGKKGEAVSGEGAERVGLVSHHLFSPKASQGVFARLGEVDEGWLGRAWKELAKQKGDVEEGEGEGVVKELQGEEQMREDVKSDA